MRKNKFGFTLGEVLVSLAVIGIIMALAAHTIKLAKSSYTAVTYHAFNNVNMIVGQLKAADRIALSNDIDSATGKKKHLPLAQMLCRAGHNGITTSILAPDHRSHTVPICREAGVPGANGGNGVADTLFCKNTVYFANTKGATYCDYMDHSNVIYDETLKEPKIKINDWNKPNFIATNGYRYYFSKWKQLDDVSTIYGFRIIAVDINGTNGPNTVDYDSRTEILPDIVQFLVLDNGEVYPIGAAGNNLKVKDKTVTYLNARVKGYYFRSDPSRSENVSSSCVQRNSDGSLSKTCNFGVLYSKNSTGESFFSYKEAYCYTLGSQLPSYESYCDKFPYEASNLCPPTTNNKRFDECNVKIVKPAFRYNFK